MVDIGSAAQVFCFSFHLNSTNSFYYAKISRIIGEIRFQAQAVKKSISCITIGFSYQFIAIHASVYSEIIYLIYLVLDCYQMYIHIFA